METIQLWEKVPGYEEGHHHPFLKFFKAKNKKGRGTVVILPGGGYAMRAAHEGDGYAEFLNGIGLDCFVLEYRVSPTRFPYPLLDARRAMRYVRANAEKYGIDPDKIAIMGSSAGGHLAEMTAVYREPLGGEGYDALDEVCHVPNAQILCYPVTDFDSHNGSYKNLLGEKYTEMMENLNPIAIAPTDTPPAFIWHTEPDATVKVESTMKYVAKLHSMNIRCELHVYPDGRHGLGVARDNPIVSRWTRDLEFWLHLMGYID